MSFHKSEYEQPYHGLEPNPATRPSQFVGAKGRTLNGADKSTDEMIIAGATTDVDISLAADVGFENDVLAGPEFGSGGLEDAVLDHPTDM